MIHHRVSGYYYISGTMSKNAKFASGNEMNIRREIYHWGPCSSGFIIHEDFLDWNGKGVYEYDKKSGVIGGHAIVIMGWGEEGGKKYWIVRNSWGKDWGDKGNFKILRGVNHCEIEENVFTGIPNIPAIRLYLEHPLYYQQEDYIYKFLWGLHDNGYKETNLELISSGKKIPPPNFNKMLYDLSAFPNFSKYIAGETKENFYVVENYYEENYYSSWKVVAILILLILILF
jgi:cathepsin B